MQDKTSAPSSASRKIRRLGVAVALVVALYSAGWFFVASKIETELDARIANPATLGLSELICDAPEVDGFPFLIGATCARSGLTTKDGLSASAGAARIAARIYAPTSTIAEIDSPGAVTAPDGSTVEATWKLLRAGASAGLDGLTSLSLTGTDIKTGLRLALLPVDLDVGAEEGQAHLRRVDRNLELAFLARKLTISSETGEVLLPEISTSLEARIDDQAEVMSGGPLRLRASSGTITSFKIETTDGLFGELSGDFDIDEEGYLNGKFGAKLDDIDAWKKRLSEIFPDARDSISAVSALLKGLAKGKDDVKVTIRVDHGRISLSMIPLGRIPPL
ncbi:hypothetical protein M2360_003046 [Rhizobium sp. SG_E_25_P2]|uniref:DUF2125 domain-containing protein n=1 Tax=Rhizobium sp. SG_E_25_P2 TaxID=2879942 RepID=UPI00247494B5|nr:DUF2125 domain-containing protein [Rhizobium sp. SG_E_25_P2]MDH6267649.1 hypothetical protein [Rhizobium sp. SG_E_25_P2]